MKLSEVRIQGLKHLLEEELGLKYKDEELEQVGLAIIRFVRQKELHRHVTDKETDMSPTNYGEEDLRAIGS
jgi:hypothetical protein